MLLLILKVLLQLFAFGLALLLSGLDYWWHDRHTRRFKQARQAFIAFALISLLGSIALTVFDDLDTNRKEEQTRRELKKVQEQNEGLQLGVAVLADQSSNILTEQRNSFVGVLGEQRKSGLDTAQKIESATNELRSGISDAIAQQENLLKKQETTINTLTSQGSYCYLHVRGPIFTGQNKLTLVMQFVGDYPLYDVSVTIYDSDKLKKRYDLGTVFVSGKVREEVDLTGLSEKKYYVSISTRFRHFYEELLFKKVNGTWTTAFIVQDMPLRSKGWPQPKLIKLYTDPDFPK